MSGPSSTGSAIRRILYSSLDKSKTAANGTYTTPQSQASRPKDNPSVIAFLNSTTSDGFVQKQFKRLGRRQDRREASGWTIETGKHRYDVNRYADVIPYDSSRVVLKSEGNGKQNSKDDYINASYVYAPKRTRRYIATQGPQENTIEAFWRMVWENISTSHPETVSTIIMLTRVTEGGAEKCAHYWPNPIGTEFQIPYRDTKSIQSLVVKLLKQEIVEESDCTVNTIQLYMRDQQGPRYQVKHLLYNGWRDMSVPTSTETFLNYFQLFRKYHTSEAPPIVHCTAGIGRTGVFIALDYLLTAVPHLTSEEILSDPVFETVDELRHWRASMPVRVSQLEYIYALFREMVLADDPTVEDSQAK
jgi:protein-tyrosine phosphatase